MDLTVIRVGSWLAKVDGKGCAGIEWARVECAAVRRNGMLRGIVIRPAHLCAHWHGECGRREGEIRDGNMQDSDVRA